MYGTPAPMPHAGFFEWLVAFHQTQHNGLFNTLLILVFVDIGTGLLKSFSKKGGGLDSTIGRMGLTRHIEVITLMFVLYPWSIAINYQWIGDLFLSAWVVMYISSIIENIGQMGIPIPSVLKQRLKKLKGKDKYEK